MRSATGSAARLRIDFADQDDHVLDVSGWSFAGQLRWRPDGDLIAALTFDLTEAATGTVYALLPSEQAVLGRYVYAIEYDHGEGLGMLPLMYGTWTLRAQVRY